MSSAFAADQNQQSAPSATTRNPFTLRKYGEEGFKEMQASYKKVHEENLVRCREGYCPRAKAEKISFDQIL